MQYHQPPPIGGIVKGDAADFDPAKAQPRELAKHLVMISGDVDDPRPAPGALQDAANNIIVLAGPIEPLLDPPAIDDVAHQIQRTAAGFIDRQSVLWGKKVLVRYISEGC